MAITHWPDDITPPAYIVCIICQREQSTTRASAGLQDSNGQQLFACDQHIKERQHILGWADFAADLQQPSFDDLEFLVGGGDECLLY